MARTFSESEIKRDPAARELAARELAATDTTDAPALIKLARRAEKNGSYENFSGENFSDQKTRVAIVGTNSVQYICKVVKFFLWGKYGIRADIFEGEYDGIAEAVLNEASAFYSFKPEIALLIPDVRDIGEFPALLSGADAIDQALQKNAAYYQALWAKILRTGCSVLQANFVVPALTQLGNLECNCAFAANTFIRKLNLFLAQEKPSGVTFVDLDSLASNVGKNKWFDYTSYFLSKQGFCLDFLGAVCELFCLQIVALSGKIRKCLVLDLDDTLWGGAVGDAGHDGIRLDPSDAVGEAYRFFQRYLLSLKDRGVILAVCSKNDMEAAREPFLKNPYMLIKLEDISCFVANWRDKATNLREIAANLNIGVDSLVFFDDNPAEREIVRLNLPEAAVIDVPADPAYYAAALDGAHCFDWLQIVKEDLSRALSYSSANKRSAMESAFVDYDKYLQALEMQARIGFLDSQRLPRFSQLTMKSNQFNLRTQRYPEAALDDLSANPNYRLIYAELRDKFDDYGLVSCVILKKIESFCFIDTWLMSCRVLKRGLEALVLDFIVKTASDLGCSQIVGEYIPTAKNSMVKNFYADLGFKKLDGRTPPLPLAGDGDAYYLNVSDHSGSKTWIHLKTD